ncbi:UDP-glucose/GDP-mannose dehydrogenase family protein [Comamonadaceae bacterium M7527]|nr:UDP-glucose/GDP-mannose dehydrogenase family protein [Comamonadaceae bacterium M7527]
MKIAVIGAGYVGLVTAVCLAEVGHDVMVVDQDLGRITLLQAGSVPIHEPGLDVMVQHNAAAHRLQFTASLQRAVEHAQVVFIAVGTPPMEDGSADMRHVLQAATDIARVMTSSKVVVNKSTVPVGAAQLVEQTIAGVLCERQVDHNVHAAVVSNPEFLREGDAIDDFLHPDRVVIGVSANEAGLRAKALMGDIYKPLVKRPEQIMWMDTASAELTKYAANAMLATRISFMNEMAALAGHVNADIDAIRRGIGSDKRIGPSFLKAGTGYGGSCFPKDTHALAHSAKLRGLDMHIVEATERVNNAQKSVLLPHIRRLVADDLRGVTLAMWGLAFKPNTNDMREAPSRVVIKALLEKGARVRLYDPVAMNEAKRVLQADMGVAAEIHPGISFVDSALDALHGAHALVVMTEWEEFQMVSLDRIKALLRQPVVIDGRNIFAPERMQQAGLVYQGVGRRNALAQAAGGSTTSLPGSAVNISAA